MPSKKHVIREIESITGYKWQASKDVFELATKPPGTVKNIRKSPMTQENAAKIVAAAKERIALVDEGD